MRIWIRIFILSTAVTLCAIAAIGIMTIRAGYLAMLDGEIRWLMRESRGAAVLIANLFQTRQFPYAGFAQSYPGSSSGAGLLQKLGSTMSDPASNIEVFSQFGELLYSENRPFKDKETADRAEITAAQKGRTTYLVRRVNTIPTLFIATPARIQEEQLVICLSAPLNALESYRKSQTSYLLITSAAAALLLSAAAFLGSRAIARRIESLSTQAGAIAAGNFHGRVTIKGRDEVGDLAARVNMIASEVEDRMERLRSEKEDRQKFIDSLTHELRTPITSIVGFAEHLRHRSYNEKIFARSLDRIHEEGLRVLRLSDSLKRLLIMRTGAREITRIPVQRFLDSLSIEARERFPERAADIRVQAVPGELDADPQLLTTALLNLIDNAVRASPDGTPIVIGFSVNDTGRSLTVRDHGPGMSGEERARAMEPFSRGPGRSGTGGFGLGLSICREIADYHDARLELESPAEGGTLASLVFKSLQ